MAIKTLNWATPGVYGDLIQNVASTTSTGFVSTKQIDDSGVFRRFTIDLQQVFGTTSVKINKVTVGGTFKISTSRSSTYQAKLRYYATNNNSHNATKVKEDSQVINTTAISRSLTATQSEFDFNTHHITYNGKECIEVAVNVYVYASSSYPQILTATDCYCTIDYTPSYGYVTFDSYFSYKKWKDAGISGEANLSISNLSDTGFTATNTSSSTEGYTNTSYYYRLTEGAAYIMKYDASGDTSREVFCFGSNNGSSWQVFPSYSTTVFNFTVQSGYPYIAHRCDVNAAGKAINYSNFRVVPESESWRADTVSNAAQRTNCNGVWNIPTPVRQGYEFVGWFDTPATTGGTQYTSSSAFPTQDLQLWSRWKQSAIWEYKVFPGTNKCFITKYNGSETSVTVPSAIDGYTVTRLGYGFHVNDFGGSEAANDVTGSSYYGPFSENSKITSVTIPSTVNWIGYQTFRKCTALHQINWEPSEPCIIGRTCLYGCTNLNVFTIPENVKEVYGYAFQNCSKFERLNFGKNVVFKTSNTNDAIPNNVFKGTSENLTLGLYHSVAQTFSSTFSGKKIYYYDALITFISDGVVVKSMYCEIFTLPIAPYQDPVKEGYTFLGWSDGSQIYSRDKIPPSKLDATTGLLDATYTAVFELARINNIYSGAVNANVYIGTSEVSAVYVGNTKIYG